MQIFTIAGAAIVMLIIGVGVWGMNQNSLPATAEPNEEVAGETQQEESTEPTKGTVADLLARTGSWKCEVQSTAGGIASNGTAHIANGSIRGTFSSKVPQLGNISITTNLLVTNGYSYTWTSLYPQGAKVALGAVSEASDGAITPETGVSYTCAAWTADPSLFTVPGDITFKEY